MVTLETIYEVLQEMKLRPKKEDEGYIVVRSQMKNILILVDEDCEDYVRMIMPSVYSLDTEDEKMCAHYVCNKLTRESKHIKIVVDESMERIDCTSEFFVNSKDALAFAMKNGLNMLSMAYFQLGVNMRSYLSCQEENEDE